MHLETGIESFRKEWVPFAHAGDTTICVDIGLGVVRTHTEYGPGGTLASFDAWVELCERFAEADVWNPELTMAELDRRCGQFTRDEQDFI